MDRIKDNQCFLNSKLGTKSKEYKGRRGLFLDNSDDDTTSRFDEENQNGVVTEIQLTQIYKKRGK